MKLSKEQMELSVVASQIISAKAIVLSIGFLAIQVDDNTRALLNQGHYNALSLFQDPLRISIENDELASIIQPGYTDPASLDDSEWYRFSSFHLLSFNVWEYVYYANIDETIPNTEGECPYMS